MKRPAALALVLLAGPALLCACGSSARPNASVDPVPAASASALGRGARTVGCDAAIIGGGRPHWRSLSAVAGPFGFFGAGRDFLRGSREADGLLHAKMPAIVEGTAPVSVAVLPAQRRRVGIEVAGGHPYARVRFVPCGGKRRTVWPAGLALRSRALVTLLVRVGAAPPLPLRVGRVT